VHVLVSSQSPSVRQQSAIALLVQAPLATSQVSAVQALLSLQSVSVEQQPATGVTEQRLVLRSQVSAVHTFMSSQSPSARQQPVIGLEPHAPPGPLQVLTVHALESSQSPSMLQQSATGTLEHPLGSEHMSLVQRFASSQESAVAIAQDPEEQTSSPLQTSASAQAVPSAANPSLGQDGAMPLQTSETSHTPVAARQTVEVPWKTLGGHAVELPVQLSAGSQSPSEDRQMRLDPA